jgi:RNA polymerase sigma-70 factor, ECF subfamily
MPELLSSSGSAAEGNLESLVEDLRAGKEAAFEAVVRQLGGRMLAVARQVLGNDADAQDAVQDAFLTAFRSLDRFEGRSNLATWLHRIVVNAALMKLRSRRRHKEQPIEDFLPTYLPDGHQARPAPRWSESSLAAIERDETRQAVRNCIDELPETHRSVLILRDIQELDTQTVAVMLEISTDAVKVRLHRARQALRTLLDSVFGASHR